MKKYSGIILILITVFSTSFFWYFASTTSQISTFRQYSQLLASLALLAFAWISFISSRLRLVDSIFNGLDKAYVFHKFLAIAAVVLIWLHKFMLNPNILEEDSISATSSATSYTPGITNGTDSLAGLGRELGPLSLYVFSALVIFFLISFMLEYETWKLLHKVMIIPYVFGIVHYYLDADYQVFSFGSYSLWMNLINILGIVFSLYSIFFYEITSFKYRYKISAIEEVANGIIEISAKSMGREMKYRAGQFAFVKIEGKRKILPSHPFSMSASYKPDEIQFSIKGAGDHTNNLKKQMKIGDVLAVSGPHGKFDYLNTAKNQIWIAGGIGITPFRAFLQSAVPESYSVDLFYSYNCEQDGAYIKELIDLSTRNNVRLHLIDYSKDGYLQKSNFENTLDKAIQYDLYFCGPVAMRKKILEDIKLSNIRLKNIHYEYFKFK
ncbi:ferredoxin reductase family protein [Parasporobacterium paucivorans]|uniref:Predicted ferric reductase n=1 Tax=Parasporobacterium paucivorans DSM 15970 TaxID=1122934 RepID=A0A1M6ELM5_9FIRM|nr:ferric reductase-like transmembrane domain-containing protein [Parasporobacterium paucivorans]SHI86354.1 Predicted ferric reductase [Parasporobacterium paucivorans DSM 15970]